VCRLPTLPEVPLGPFSELFHLVPAPQIVAMRIYPSDFCVSFGPLQGFPVFGFSLFDHRIFDAGGDLFFPLCCL